VLVCQDYRAYLDFVLALENRNDPASIAFLFRILDFRHERFLNVLSLHHFYKVCGRPRIRHCPPTRSHRT
jgi:serine/threonine-protein phosphatase 2A regulatory subunit B''